MKTAEEILLPKFNMIEDDVKEACVEAMIEFARAHVQAALEAAAEQAIGIDSWNDGAGGGNAASVDRDSIIEAYQLDKIQ